MDRVWWFDETSNQRVCGPLFGKPCAQSSSYFSMSVTPCCSPTGNRCWLRFTHAVFVHPRNNSRRSSAAPRRIRRDSRAWRQSRPRLLEHLLPAPYLRHSIFTMSLCARNSLRILDCRPTGTRFAPALARPSSRSPSVIPLPSYRTPMARSPNSLYRSGIGDCFRTITDSGIVGHEKPHPIIFETALKTMNARPNTASTLAMCTRWTIAGPSPPACKPLFDASGAYRDKGLPRVESLDQLMALIL